MLRFLYCILIFIFAPYCSTLAIKKSTEGKLIRPVQTSIVVDTKTGKVLHSKNSRIKIYPASLTKMMTIYIAFDSIKSGSLKIDQKLAISKNAEKMKPSKLGLKAGEYITLQDAILGLIVKSANDAAVVIAESVCDSEMQFAQLMNKYASNLQMKDTIFKNASGWHNPQQKTTAFDLVKLSIALKKDHPKLYPLLSKTKFHFRGKIIQGHNKVVASYTGAEAGKTGYTKLSGFNLITLVSRNNKSLIGVVTGGRSATSRDKTMVQLLDKHLGVKKSFRKKYKLPI